MLKQIFLALWICAITLASAVTQQKLSHVEDSAAGSGRRHPEKLDELTYFETELLSTAVIIDGVVRGYVLGRFQYAIDEKRHATSETFDPAMLVSDAFASNFAAGLASKGDAMWAPDVDRIKEEMLAATEAIAGEHVIGDILVGQLDFLAKEEARSSSAARREALVSK